MTIGSSKRRKNQAEAAERQWAEQNPADYVNQNKEAMDAVAGQVGSGFDWDTASDAYQQYRQRATQNAQAAADNARTNAANLAGGYGSSYADSVAQQNQRQALASIDNALPSLRSQALAEYQDKQNSLLNALSGMVTTEGLDRSAYGLNLGNFQNWRNYLANKTAQARAEYANDKNNLWNWVKNIGSAALTAYDGYKGYTQQQWANEFAERQYEDQKKLNIYSEAFDLYGNGATDAADQLLAPYGVTSEIFKNMNAGNTQYSLDDQITGMKLVNSLIAAGQPGAAQWAANAYGLPEGIFNYNLATGSSTKSGGSGRSSDSSGGTSGSSKSGSGWTNSQLRSMAKDFSSMDESDDLYDFYRQTLVDNGWISDGKGSTDDVLSRVLGYAQKGYNPSAITVKLQHEGYSNEDIARIFNRVGIKG